MFEAFPMVWLIKSSTICTWNNIEIIFAEGSEVWSTSTYLDSCQSRGRTFNSTAKAVVGVPQSGEEIVMNDGCAALVGSGQVEDWGENGLMRKTSGKRWMGKQLLMNL